MSFGHERWRPRVTLLASGALEDPERAATQFHLEACASCRSEYDATVRLLSALDADQVRAAELPIPWSSLLTRVQARLDEPTPAHGWRWGWAAALATVSAAVALAMMPRVLGPAGPKPAPAVERVAVSADALRRLERNLAREQAVRYLNEAQDLLVTFAAAPRSCDRERERLDVQDETRRSRDLLARRALLEVDNPSVASAEPVLADVKEILREVAGLESCVRARDVERLQREIERRRLLMKIRLMTRELQG